jgi:hypothetical protein
MAQKIKKAEPAVVETPTEAIEVSDADDSSTALTVDGEFDEWDFGEDANKGFQNLSRDEFSIPFYGLLQSNSEIVKQNKIPGGRGGLFLNSMTGELFEKLIVQPIYVERVIVQWAPRGTGKNIVARHQYNSKIVQDAIARNGGSIISTKEKPLLAAVGSADTLVDTRYLYFQRLADDGLKVIGFGVLPFSKTKITPLVNATSAINQAGLKAPTWSGRFVMTADLKQKGPDSWHNVTIKAFGRDNLLFDKTNLLPPRHPLFVAGKNLEASIVGGVHKADFSQEDKFAGEGGGGESIDTPGACGRHF